MLDGIQFMTLKITLIFQNISDKTDHFILFPIHSYKISNADK
jgi:hypothetical protein